MTSALFDPITIGALALAHRVVHAPMARRSAHHRVGPPVSGWLRIYSAPEIYTDRHVDRWRPLVDAVQERDALSSCHPTTVRAPHSHVASTPTTTRSLGVPT
jgi:2,4-dienoyl-CoA reductase-like NADH-dependent reductase (Old Yellow Enzyme family)